MKNLYFMRHGTSINNQIGEFSGRLDSPLADEGRNEVRKTAESIKHLSIDRIVSSPLSRAKESAHITAEVIGYPIDRIVINDLFEERDYGVLEGTEYTPLKVRDDIDDIETVEELIHRAQRGLEWLETLDEPVILLVSHGSFGRALSFVISQKYPDTKPAQFKNAELIQLI
jgi:uncharacterized phosphatase